MKNRKKLLALDIGNVCIKLQPEAALAKMGFAGFDDVPKSIWEATEKLETGKMEPEEYFKTCADLLRLPSDAPVREWFNTILADEVEGMREQVEYLVNNNWEFVFLSDISAPHLEEVRRKVSFFDLAKGGIFSFRVGCWKPADGMYLAFEEEFGKPDLFVDDRAVNIEAAQKLGWNARMFEGAEQFRKIIEDFS